MVLVELGLSGWPPGRRRSLGAAERAGMLVVELEFGGGRRGPTTARKAAATTLSDHRVSTNLKSIFTPLPLPRGCHAARDVAG
jgi:hypothetical protein